MKTGLFFGSFNPIHVGHLVLANYFAEFTDLDEVWFVVSPHNPLKNKAGLLKDHHRYQMVEMAIEGFSKFKVSNIEFKLSQPSYTIQTLSYLYEKYPKHKFSLIMGSDNLSSFHKWKNYEAILEHHQIYVYPRPGFDGGKFKNHPQIVWTDAPLMEISSTAIREAIKQKKEVPFYMPQKVYEYMRDMHFYEK